ncbi:hypothetical protein [Natrinema sp. CGMCC1.2065]|uniref:hypothetical protein n=1 Tax=Natrinema sp. CGMCC1.2065 TaxID=3445767 RepID=UPI003F4A1701
MTDKGIVRRLNAVIGLQVVILGVIVASTLPAALLPVFVLGGVLFSPTVVLALLLVYS